MILDPGNFEEYRKKMENLKNDILGDFRVILIYLVVNNNNELSENDQNGSEGIWSMD